MQKDLKSGDSTQNLVPNLSQNPPPSDFETAMQTLIEDLSNLPDKPGIYQYYDKNSRLLYVGKAKSLKNRVRSYFALTQTKLARAPIPSPQTSQRIAIMVRQIAKIALVVVDSEQDALILENSLIKQMKPKYNVLLRDDKTYPYIAFDLGLDFPVPFITRSTKNALENGDKDSVKNAKDSTKSAKIDSAKKRAKQENIASGAISANTKKSANAAENANATATTTATNAAKNTTATPTTPAKNSIIYFGPYPSGAREIVDSLLELFPLVQRAPSCVTQKKACLFYQIRRCLAPCENRVNKQEYRQIIDSAINSLKTPSKLYALLEDKMLQLAESMRFEEAATYRDRLKKLANLQSLSTIDLAKDTNLDVVYFYALDSGVGYVAEDVLESTFLDSSTKTTHPTQTQPPTQRERKQKLGVLLWLFVREGKIVSFTNEMVGYEHSRASEVYTQAILNRYSARLPLLPEAILLPSAEEFGEEDLEMLLAFLASTQGRKIPILSPKRGARARLLELACKNAQEILQKSTQENADEYAILSQLQELLSLPSAPLSIEVFDTSHHSGSDCVGGMVVYENGAFVKDKYRRYKLQGSDEYSQMREMLTRRALSFEENPPPDMWLIDGGKAQVMLAREILESSGVNADNIGIIGIAKEKRYSKEERYLNEGRDPKISRAANASQMRANRAKGSAHDKIYVYRGAGQMDFDDVDSSVLDSDASFEAESKRADFGAEAESSARDFGANFEAKSSNLDSSDFRANVEILRLSPNDRRLQFLQKLRDEVHRYAITYHRNKKQKSMLAHADILARGISEGQIKRLLALLGSYEAIKNLSADEAKELLKKR